MNFYVWGSVCALVVLTTSDAIATPKPPDSRIEKAKVECAAGNPLVGVRLLAEVYAQTNLPVFVYNQGRCYEQNSMREQAISRFEEYLRIEKSLAPKEIAEVRARIAGLQASIDQNAKFSQASPEPQVYVPSQANTDVSTEARHESVLRTETLITGVIGMVSLGVGVSCNLKANSLTNDLNKLLDNGQWDQEKEDNRKAYNTAGWIGYGIGAAALVTSATLYTLSASKNAGTPSSVTLIPALLPGSVMLAIQKSY